MKKRTMIKLAATAFLAFGAGFGSTQQLRAQDPEQQQQQQQQQQQPQPGELDQATEQAIQAATDAAAAAAYQAGLEAQQQQGDMQSMMQPPTTQVAPDEEEPAPGPTNGGRTPTTRPINRNRMQFSRRTTSTTRPTAAAQPAPRPRSIYTDYALLLHRSIFIKGVQTNVIDPKRIGPTTGPTNADDVRAERNLVFNGLTESDEATALIEDIVSHRMSKLHVGDSIASGKITRISFDDLDYTAVNGKVTTVQIGENLEGNAPSPTSAPSSYASSSSGGGTSGGNTGGSASGNNASGGGGAGSPAPVNPSVLERMRQRRMQETGGR
jgi:hypothetical protein